MEHGRELTLTEEKEEKHLRRVLKGCVQAYKKGKEDCEDGKLYTNPYNCRITVKAAMYHDGYWNEFIKMCTGKRLST